MLTLFYLSSGMFLGWSLGANDSANVFGTAVGSKMLSFKTGAFIFSIFVIIGAIVGGSGTTQTLGNLGSVSAIAGAFMVATAAALTVSGMVRIGIPVSTSQTIVGALLGWNLFTGSLTNYTALTKIVSAWVAGPILAAVFAIALFLLLRAFFNRMKIHLLKLDRYLRLGLILVGTFAAYSLGANNIANVMGVFVPVSPVQQLNVFGLFKLSAAQQLFLLGGLAIAVGVYTNSQKVMRTIGSGIFRLSPEAALVVVLANALVLFLFSSIRLQTWLLSQGLPAFPLVPISSTQAVIGAILGIGLIKGARGIDFKLLGGIALGWITSPVISAIITFVGLFFLQNVFQQKVAQNTNPGFSRPAIRYMAGQNLETRSLTESHGENGAIKMPLQALLQKRPIAKNKHDLLRRASEKPPPLYFDSVIMASDWERKWLAPEQISTLRE